MLVTQNRPAPKLLIAFLLALIGILIACTAKKEKEGKDIGNKALKVTAVIAREVGTDQVLSFSGTVIAFDDIELKSEITGRITEILFKEGGNVLKGQVLVRLNDKEIRSELQKAVYERDLLGEKEGRQKHLLGINAISQEEYDNSLKALNVIKAHISLLTAQLEKTELRAPFSGVAGLRYVSEGAVLTPATLITTLQNINPLKLEFSIPEKYSREIKTGTRILFTIEGLDSAFHAEVFAIEPRIDPTSRTLKMRALFKNPNRLVLPGAFANIRFTPNGRRNSIMIPSQAIIPDAGGAKVFVKKNGMSENRRVQTGYRSKTHIEILSGVDQGDTVLTSGILQLRPGMLVQAIINP